MANKPESIHINIRTAAELFTDRENPQILFWETYEELKNEPGSYDIIHYYGEGGIGKTTLLMKLMDDLVKKKNYNAIIYSFQANKDKDSFSLVDDLKN